MRTEVGERNLASKIKEIEEQSARLDEENARLKAELKELKTSKADFENRFDRLWSRVANLEG
ncbi:MAG: hypothetical protein HY402_06530 [Elusimicrobia bacterium]|nr:hypothetical protein [Elusimicrobiota bacterium]